MDEAFINDLLKQFSKEGLLELIQHLIANNKNNNTLALEWIRKHEIIETKDNIINSRIYNTQLSERVNESLINQYWNEAEKIISQFNEFGGGPYYEEEETYTLLNSILDILYDNEVSRTVRINLIDNVFKEYNKNNSGFEDILLDICLEACKTRDDWLYLVEKLKQYPSDWRNSIIMGIYKNHLDDDKSYLEMRKSKLEYGMDYWDLADFYLDRDNIEEAAKICEEGILKGEGRIKELLSFLLDYYAEKDDIDNMKRIIERALKSGSDREAMFLRLFDYYKNKDMYEEAKETLLRSADYMYPLRAYAKYKEIKDFVKSDEWVGIEDGLIEVIKDCNYKAYLEICMEKKMKEVVIESIKNIPKNKYGYRIIDDFDEFAERLKEDYPKEIIEYYYRRAFKNIENGNRKTYKVAVKYLDKAKDIYVNILKDEKRWYNKIIEIKNHYSRRRAFLDEASNL